MSMTDPIADLLTRIRNAAQARHATTDIPGSKLKRRVAEILVEEGYLDAVEWLDDGKQGTIRVTLKYANGQLPVIEGLERASRPSRRFYVGKDEIPYVLRGLGVAILSTSKGVMTDQQARDAGVGGELLVRVW